MSKRKNEAKEEEREREKLIDLFTLAPEEIVSAKNNNNIG